MTQFIKKVLASFFIVLFVCPYFIGAHTTFAQGTPDNTCKDGITVKWIDATGTVVTTPVVGGVYRARVDFSQDPDCAGKITTDVLVLRDGSGISACGALAVSATDPAVLCEFTPPLPGTYTVGIKYKDINGTIIEKVVSGPSLTVAGPTATPTPIGGGPGTTPTPVGGGGTVGTITNPISFNSLGALIVGVIKFLMTMLGALAVLFIIIGAVRMVASAGNESAVKAGKSTVTWAVIGLATALLAFSFISLLQSVLGRN